MPFVATNGFKTKTTSFYWDQSLLTTMEWKYSAMWNLVSAVLSIRLFLLQEKSMIYHLGGRDKEDLGGGRQEHMAFRGRKREISRPLYIIKREVPKKIDCQSTPNERGTITIL